MLSINKQFSVYFCAFTCLLCTVVTTPLSASQQSQSLLTIAEMNVDGRIYDLTGNNIVLPYNSKLIEIHYQYQYQNLQQEQQQIPVNYRIRLEGFEQNWRDNQHASKATFTNLAAGDYRFTVRALSDGRAVAEASIEFSREAHPLLSSAAYFLYFSFLVIWLVFYTSNHQRQLNAHKVAAEREHTLASELRSLSLHLDKTREEERATVARELHDELAQVLVAIKLEMNWIHTTLERNDSLAVISRMPDINKTIETCVNSVKNIAMGLRPSVLDDMGLIPAISWYVDNTSKRANLQAEFYTNCEELKVSKHLAINIYRMVQETISNVIKHSGASKVVVSAVLDINEFTLKVADNGCGINDANLEKLGHYGLIGLRERVASFDGKVSIQNKPASGLAIEIVIPV
jgi:signal transduction histidine kinase